MTLIKPDGDDGTSQSIIREAAEHFQRAITAFNAASESAQVAVASATKEGDATLILQAEKIARLLAGATQVYIKEKQKIETSVKTEQGIVYDYAIDFATAREEIRRRMACLRNAAGAGEVSE